MLVQKDFDGYSSKICPKCKVGELYERVKRPFIIKLISIIYLVRRYRCSECYKKTYVL